jgi:hypothetical protein
MLLRQTLYYWYTLGLFGYTYFRYRKFNQPGRFWIVSTYHRGSVTISRIKEWKQIKQYLKANKSTVKRHFMSGLPIPERYLHSSYGSIVLEV